MKTLSPKSRCQKDWLLLRIVRGNLFHSYLLPLGTTENHWLIDAPFQSLLPPSHGILYVSLSLDMAGFPLCCPPLLIKTTFILHEGPTLLLYDPILINYMSNNPVSRGAWVAQSVEHLTMAQVMI